MTQRSITLAFAALALVSLSCDKAQKLTPKERRISLATTNANVCPDPSTGQGETTVVATIYGEDGTVAPDVPVTFSADSGTLSESTVRTNVAGQASTVLSTPRPIGDLLTVVGALADGRSDDVDINAPLPPFVSLVPQQIDPVSGSVDQFALTIASACNINALDISFSWEGGAKTDETPYRPDELLVYSYDDPDQKNIGEDGGTEDPDSRADGESFQETGILNETKSGTEVPTEWQVIDSSPGRLRVLYRRTDPSSGTSDAGTYFRVGFKAGVVLASDSREKRRVTFSYDTVTVTPIDGRPYQFGGERIAMPILEIQPKTTPP